MAKIAVGGTDGLIDRFLMMMGWRATVTITDQERKDALFWINLAERFVAATDGLLYLNREWPLTLGAASSAIAVPTTPALDFGKDFVIEDANGFPLKYCSLEEFSALLAPGYDAITTGPSGFMVIIDSADEILKFRFKPVQGVAPQNVTLRGQRAIIALLDDVASFSLLPEGYEIVLLLPIAEQAAKQRKHEIDAATLDNQTQRTLGEFYGKFRTNKRTTASDTNEERRIGEDQAAAGLTR